MIAVGIATIYLPHKKEIILIIQLNISKHSKQQQKKETMSISCVWQGGKLSISTLFRT